MGFGEKTRFRMADGSIQEALTLIVGDELMGWDSFPRQITSIEKGRGPLVAVERIGYVGYLVDERHPLCLIKDEDTIGTFLEMSASDYPEHALNQYGVGVNIHFPYARDIRRAYSLGKRMGKKFYAESIDIPDRLVESSLASRLQFLIGMIYADEENVSSNYCLKTMVRHNFLMLLDLLRGLGMRYEISMEDQGGLNGGFCEYLATIHDEDNRIDNKGKFNAPDGIYLVKQALTCTEAGQGERINILLDDEDRRVQLDDGTIVIA